MKRILFRCDRRIPEEQAAELFSALGWFSGEYPKELAASLRQAHRLVTAWDGPRLAGLCSTLADGVMTVYVNYLLLLPAYRGKGLGRMLLRLTLMPYQEYRRFLLMSDEGVTGFYEKFGFSVDSGSFPMVLVRR